MLKRKTPKGAYGYLDENKFYEWKKAAAMLAVPLVIFLAGCLINGSRLNILTVVAIVGCLPGCNQIVHAILASRYHSMDRELYEEVERLRGDRLAIYENVFTTYDKNFYVDCIVISGREVAGYTTDVKTDANAAAEHLKKSLRDNSYKQNVKIFTERRMFLERVRTLAEQEPENVPFREDDRYPGMTRDEVVRHTLQSLAL